MGVSSISIPPSTSARLAHTREVARAGLGGEYDVNRYHELPKADGDIETGSSTPLVPFPLCTGATRKGA